jgi:predicted nuclease of predicted toxin-antitoxin system
MKRVVLDQNLPARAAGILRAEVNLSRESDDEIISWAEREDRCCVTRDADFHRILVARRAVKPSVVRLRGDDLNAQDTADVLQRVWLWYEAAIDAGTLVTATETRIRVRRLPIEG